MNRREFLITLALLTETTLFGISEEFDDSLSIFSKDLIAISLLKKLTKIQNQVGCRKFNIISFDEMYKTASYLKCSLSKKEIFYIENIFYGNPKLYGFSGSRTIRSLTESVNSKNITYIEHSGHYLFKGDAIKKYKEIKNLIGPELILTSGIRMPVKQLYLFLKKSAVSNGNLRIASTSIAPPGFTFHSIGDFDIGKAGYGMSNFTERFQETDVFKKLYDGQYISIRYPKDNSFGVRYEPWHIKVVKGSDCA